MLRFEEEVMSEVFTKWHIIGLPFSAVIHRFTGIEKNEDFHDHPWPFTTIIMDGGYLERVYKIGTNGKAKYRDEFREPGSCQFVPADRIHKIIDLPTGSCTTLVLPGPPTNTKSRFWKFEKNRIWSRAWDEQEFQLYQPPLPQTPFIL